MNLIYSHLILSNIITLLSSRLLIILELPFQVYEYRIRILLLFVEENWFRTVFLLKTNLNCR